MWRVYILLCSDGSFYTGITNDIQRRLATHRSGKGSKYVRSRLPIRLLWQEEASDRSSASKRESEIKKMSRAHKEALVKSG